MTRLVAVQAWPVRPKPPCAAMPAATVGSASSKTTSGFLPPISSRIRACRAVTIASISRPTALDPVKETAARSG
jgi:hypothetical protein